MSDSFLKSAKVIRLKQCFCCSFVLCDHLKVFCLRTASEKNVQKRNKMFLSPGRESKSFGDFGKLRRQDEVDRMRGLETTQGDEDDEVEILALQGNSQDMWENYVEVIESDDEDEQDAASQVSSALFVRPRQGLLF